MQRASVSVQVRESRSRPILVMGAVRSRQRWHSRALDAARGAGRGGRALRDARRHPLRAAPCRRPHRPGRDLASTISSCAPTRDVNIPIFANDLINVPATSTVTVYCLGEVGTPGAISFTSTDRITLLAAIARAGGLTDRASRKIEIKRSGKDEPLHEWSRSTTSASWPGRTRTCRARSPAT